MAENYFPQAEKYGKNFITTQTTPLTLVTT
jgi:hypothetical protein